MISGCIGNLGAGKTLFITAIGYMLHNSGYTIYSNYWLKFPHKQIETTEILDELTTTHHNVLLLDELWISADARHSMQDRNVIVSRMIAQSRKAGCEVLYTVQWISQIESRIKTLTGMLFHPKIFVRDNLGRPTVLNVDIYSRELLGDLEFKKNIFVNVRNICDMYKTEEIIKPSKDIKLKKMIEKYNVPEYRLMGKSELLAKLTIDESDISIREARTVVDYIAGLKP